MKTKILKLLKVFKTMGIILGAIVVVILIWAGFDYGHRFFFPPGDTVIDLCKEEDVNAAEDRKYCRWVIPQKYLVHPNESPDFFTVRVPLKDVDPSFPNGEGMSIAFQFWRASGSYYSFIRFKKERAADIVVDDYGLQWLGRDQVYFKGFDGVEIYASLWLPKDPQPKGNIAVILLRRPLGPQGEMNFVVPIRRLESERAYIDYLQRNLPDIDRRLMQFIDQWH